MPVEGATQAPINRFMKYIYKAKKGPKEVVEGELEASSEAQALKLLDAQGLVPIRLKTGDGSGKSSVKKRADIVVKRKEILLFMRNLANLLKGNVPVLRALVLLEGQARKGGMKNLTADLSASVRAGLTLSEAFEQNPRIFSPLLVNMVRGGESGGVLGEMMEKLALHQERNEEIRGKIWGALVYPVFILAMGSLTVFVLLTYFLPRLLGVYLSNQQDLPWPTAVVLGISHFLSGNWYWILGFALLTFAFVKRFFGQSSKKRFFDEIKLKIPFVRSLVIKSAVLNFSRTLGLLLEHGVPLFKAVPLSAATVDNEVIGNRFKEVEGDLVVKGASLAVALKKISYFPPMALDMVSVGEESGNLGKTLSYLSDTYEKEIEGLLKSSTTLIEPVLILAVGGIIGFIVFAMLLPVFQMDVMGGV